MTELFDHIDKNLLSKFKEFHLSHPHVYEQFRELANKMKAVRDKYSAWTIINMIRWDHDIKGGEPFKINNDFIALYARLLIYHDHSFEGFFELRTMKASNRRDSSEERYRQGQGRKNYP